MHLIPRERLNAYSADCTQYPVYDWQRLGRPRHHRSAGPGGVIGVTVLKVGDYLLDLELSAAQAEGRGEVVSNPRVITADQTKAVIKQGTQLPYIDGKHRHHGGAIFIQGCRVGIECHSSYNAR